MEAVDNQPWSGEANVHVSIVNWAKTLDPTLVPRTKRLWSKSTGVKVKGKPAAKHYELDHRDVVHINSALSDVVDVSVALPLTCNTSPKRTYQGVTPGHKGFVLTGEQKKDLEKDGISADVIHPYLTGRELVSGDGTPERFIIDFELRDILQAQHYKRAFAHIEKTVLPARQTKAEQGKDKTGKMRSHHKQFLDRWWCLAWDRAEFFATARKLNNRYIVCSRVTHRPIFLFLTNTVWPSDKVQAFVFDDDYSFGILQADVHWRWFIAKAARLKNETDYSYSADSVFGTFPWPQNPSESAVRAVAEAGREVRECDRRSGVDAGLGCGDVRYTFPQAPDSASRSPPGEPHGDPVGLSI